MRSIPPRVGFGTGYANHTLFEIFLENQSIHPILIPYVQDEPRDKYAHLRFQNGTIWRWNRPLVGFDYDGQPHIRIEHRVIPAGPTTLDCVANCAAFYGFVRGLANLKEPIEEKIPFSIARANFYAAAKDGLDANVVWTDGEVPIRQLILDSLLPMAREAFASMEIPQVEIDEYLDILQGRAETGQNGASWQRTWIEKHGVDFEGLIQAYVDLQETDEPVHTWSILMHCDLRHEISAEVLECSAIQLADVLNGPTLFDLSKPNKDPLFVSVLLHGNETSGWEAVRKLFSVNPELSQTSSVLVFIGNVLAAKNKVRKLDDQPDYNRVWNGGCAVRTQISRRCGLIRSTKEALVYDRYSQQLWSKSALLRCNRSEIRRHSLLQDHSVP